MKQSSTPRREAISLAVIAGYVDGCASCIWHLCIVHEWNTTLAGLESGQGHFLTALVPALAIAGFIVGSFIGSWLA
jgi:uncharacterized membrane protein YoaK (UPF0700 family)